MNKHMILVLNECLYNLLIMRNIRTNARLSFFYQTNRFTKSLTINRLMIGDNGRMQDCFRSFFIICYLSRSTFAMTKKNNMQHLLLSLLFVAATLGMSPIPAPSHDGDDVIIEIKNAGGTSSGNRTLVPISGYYDASLYVVNLFFSSPCGMVNITFSNLSTGDNFETIVNGSGAVMIPAALSSGSWTVTFSLPDGTVYIGEFNL